MKKTRTNTTYTDNEESELESSETEFSDENYEEPKPLNFTDSACNQVTKTARKRKQPANNSNMEKVKQLLQAARWKKQDVKLTEENKLELLTQPQISDRHQFTGLQNVKIFPKQTLNEVPVMTRSRTNTKYIGTEESESQSSETESSDEDYLPATNSNMEGVKQLLQAAKWKKQNVKLTEENKLALLTKPQKRERHQYTGLQNVKIENVTETEESVAGEEEFPSSPDTSMKKRQIKEDDALFTLTLDKTAKNTMMINFSDNLKQFFTKQFMLNLKAPRPENQLIKTNSYPPSVTPVFYVMLDEDLVRQHYYTGIPKINAFESQLRKLVKRNSLKRKDDSIIRDVSYYTRKDFLRKTSFSLWYATSLELPMVTMPPTLNCGYFPKSCKNSHGKKAYLRSRYIEAFEDYQCLSNKSVTPTTEKFKMGQITDHELLEWHKDGRHIHGFFVVWEKIDEFFIDYNEKHIKKRYLVDIFNLFMFPLYVDYCRWDIRLRVSFDKIVAYNLNLAEFLRKNKPVIEKMNNKLSKPYNVQMLSELLFGAHKLSKFTPWNPIQPYVPSEFLKNGIKMSNRQLLVPQSVVNGTTKKMEKHGPLPVDHNGKVVGTFPMECENDRSYLKRLHPMDSVAIRAMLNSEKRETYLNFVNEYQTQKEAIKILDDENEKNNLLNAESGMKKESYRNVEEWRVKIIALKEKKLKLLKLRKKKIAEAESSENLSN